MKKKMQNKIVKQRGGTLLGFIVGGVVGLIVALAITIYVNHVPVPFFQHDDTRTLQQDEAEAVKNKDWNPNAFLFGPKSAAPAAVNSGEPVTAATQNPAAPVPSETVVTPAVQPVSPTSTPSNMPVTAPAAPIEASAILGTSSSTVTPDAHAALLYFVQIGAYQSRNEADAQRANLSINGVMAAKITSFVKDGVTYYRVRLGPYKQKMDATGAQSHLKDLGITSNVVQGVP